MHLTENESRLQDYLDGQLPAEESQVVEAHLAECAQCHALFEQWQQLDSQLAQAISIPALSASFHDRLRRQVALSSQTKPVPAGDRQQLQTEDQATWNALQKNFLRAHLPALLDGLGYSTAAAVGAYLLMRLILTAFNSYLKSLNLSSDQLTFGIAVVAGLIFVMIGLGAAARKQLATWAEDLSA